MRRFTTGHTQDPQPLALAPCSHTEREVHRLLTDPAEQQSQLQKQAETIGEEVAFHERIRRSEGKRAV